MRFGDYQGRAMIVMLEFQLLSMRMNVISVLNLQHQFRPGCSFDAGVAKSMNRPWGQSWLTSIQAKATAIYKQKTPK